MVKGTSSVGDDHRCGACHNTFDAKVKIELLNKYEITKNAQLSLSFSSVIFCVPFQGNVEGFIYLALGSSHCGVNVFFRYCLLLCKGVLMYLQRSVQLVS